VSIDGDVRRAHAALAHRHRYIRRVRTLPQRLALVAALASAFASPVDAQPADTAGLVVRINQLGYRPADPKVAVACALDSARVATFVVRDEGGRVAFGPAPAAPAGSFGPCATTHRLDFSALRRPGRYRVEIPGATSPAFPVGERVYAGVADSMLVYMRQQRSGWSPLFRDSTHRRDGIIVDHPTRSGYFQPVTGGWADASDYLQYVTTSAHATWVMLAAWRDHPSAFGDAYRADGMPGANRVPDILDEARHGIAWLLRMFPDDSTLFNQLADDRDHNYPDLPTTDSSDYGWGKGGARPVYPCTGKPQGLFGHNNRANGKASTAGKVAAALAAGSRAFASRDRAFADTLARRARAAYELGRKYPGACQTAPGRAPNFYEEDSWADDMELAASQLHALTGERRYLVEGLEYAAREPVTPWMGADTARHYQWFPWFNHAHHELWRTGDSAARRTLAGYYRQGLERVAARAGNGFRVGIPFIWCSNDLMVAFATQAFLYRRMTGDERFRALEAAALDWLFGANPWGVSMVVGIPSHGSWARDPHSVVWKQRGVRLTGGLLDGPVYRSIYQNLIGIRLHEPDEYARFNTGFIVYHDDYGDYSTNEPIMDGTASFTFLLSGMLSPPPARP
jgi:endoglucanase